MKRRILLSGLMALPFAASARAEQAWSAELLQGNFDGKAYQAGLRITLQPGWKTYWRNPGEGGIPPTITVDGDNLASFTVVAPLPIRIEDEGGEAIGYHDEVVFPLFLTPKNVAGPLAVSVKSFFGVCAQVCSPAKFEGELQFQHNVAPSASAQKLNQWLARVPQKQNFIAASSVRDGQLVLELQQPVDDIFVEGPDRYYFRKPDLNHQAGTAIIKVDGLKADSGLMAAKLRITAAAQGHGIEQTITLAS
ncbi:MAG: protein-disulfide reductase DsbD domain-containing protein [Aestuariivirga sp.]